MLVFFDGGEAADRRVEAVVGVVVVALTDLAEQDGAGAGLDVEVVVQVLRDVDALARGQTDLRAGRDGICLAVAVDGHVGDLVDGLIGQAVVDADEHVAAAAVDDVLGLVPVEMVWGILPFLHVEQLLGVDLRILVLHGAIAVADGDEREADLVEITETVVRDVPAEHAVAHLVVFVALGLPLLGREAAERRQVAMLPRAHGFELLERFVDL